MALRCDILRLLALAASCCGGCACPQGMSLASDGELDAAEENDGPAVDVPGDGWVPCEERRCPCGMIEVPAGPFVMGTNEPESVDACRWSLFDASPKHVVWLSTYCIDRTEATYGQWRECSRAGACPPIRWEDGCVPWTVDDAAACITREAAAAYCRWAGKRLPTEAQWEKAARGGCEVTTPAECGPEDERTYPWGDDLPTCELAAFRISESGRGDICTTGVPGAVGIRPRGASPYGVLDMAGNVAEWVSDVPDPDFYASCADGCVDPEQTNDPTHRSSGIARGGSASSPACGLTVTARGEEPTRCVPSCSMPDTGVRCVAPPR